MKKIGVLTSGGDCGGLNGVIKGAAQMANSLGIECYVIPNGYAGLYNLVEFDKLVKLDPDRADMISVHLAGSEAGHSRVKVKMIDDTNKYNRIKDGMKAFGLDGLVISGGDDSGSVMVDLSENGISCIHAPKTMDLDLQPYSVGFDSTVNRIADFAQDLKTTGRTHNRVIVLEVFGRYAGHTAFRSGIAADADAILIPEVPVDFDILYKHCKLVLMNRINKSDVYAGTCTIIVAEGLKNANGQELHDEYAGVDSFGHKKLTGSGRYVQVELEKRFKDDAEINAFMKKTHQFVKGANEIPEIRTIVPGHLVRCGNSSVYDGNFGKEIGASAILLLEHGMSGVTIVGINGRRICYMKTKDAIIQRHVDLNEVSFHEKLGVCFGRAPEEFIPEFEEKTTHINRYLDA
jgi:6-phosphofructokinase 1